MDIYLQDIKLNHDSFAVVNLGEGDVDWAAVRLAFAGIAYSDSVIVELPGSDEDDLRDVSQPVDRLVLARP